MKFCCKSYARNEETLVAIVTNMAFTEYDQRTPKYLAKSLSIPEKDILFCLDNFKSLFRKSLKVSKNSQSTFYALQIRHAQQWLKGNEEESGDTVIMQPLSAEHYQLLINHITSKAAAERGGRVGFYIATVSAVAAVVAAYIALFGEKCS